MASMDWHLHTCSYDKQLATAGYHLQNCFAAGGYQPKGYIKRLLVLLLIVLLARASAPVQLAETATHATASRATADRVA